MNEPEIFNVEYWINGCHYRDEVVLYPDTVDMEDSSETIDQVLCELHLEDRDSVARTVVGNEVVTVWNRPEGSGYSRQYDIQEAA